MSRPGIVAIAWLLCTFTTLLVMLSAGLSLLGLPTREDLDFLPFVFVCAVVGSLIIANQPGNRVGWLLAGGAASFALMAFSGHYGLYGLAVEPGSLPAAHIIVWPQTWLWVPGAVALYLLLPLYFPNGQLLSPRWRAGSWLIVATGAFILVVTAFYPGESAIQMRAPDGSIVNPLGIELFGAHFMEANATTFDVILPLFGFVLLCMVATNLIVRYRRASGIERQQMKWLTYAIVGLPATTIISRVSPALDILVGLYLVSIPVAIGIAILHYDLYDIDLIINRTLVYGALTGGVIGVYVLIVGYLGNMLHEESSLLVSLVATGIVAVLFQPVRERLQRGVNRLMYGERDEPYAVISRLGQRIEDTLTPDAVLPAIVETVAQALKLPYAAISLGSQSPIIAATGTPADNLVHLPLVYRNEPVGELTIAPRRAGENFSAADQRLLDDLTRQAGIAAHAVRLSTELQHSRERLVTAREEERRRLRRDLHDGLGPALASMTLQAEAARDLMSANPEQTDALLAELTLGLQEATVDIRRLVYGLRPPALDDLGLLPALRNYAARFGPGGPDITIQAAEPLPALPAAVEVAAYRIIQESLTNVIRHAQATTCTVTIRLADGYLHINITDNGSGLPADWEGGVGLHSMQERAAELGGSCTIEALPNEGTHVSASLPCGSPPDSRIESSTCTQGEGPVNHG